MAKELYDDEALRIDRQAAPFRAVEEPRRDATKRKFRPNLCEVTLISDALGRKFRLRVSAHALKSVEHRGGLDAFLLKAADEELSERCLKMKREVKKLAKAARPAA